MLGGPLLTLPGINPLHWSTATFIVLAAGTLLLHFLIPRSERWSLRLLRETLLVIPAILLYFLVRGLVNAHSATASAHALRVIDFERSLGIFWEPYLQRKILASNLIVDLVNWVYVWGHWPFIIVVLIWLAIFHQEKFVVYRNTVFISGLIGFSFFLIYPEAPPRLVEGISVVDTITLRSQSYRVLQPPALADPYAAMPSLHFGWNLVMGIAVFRVATRWPVRITGVIVPVAMFCAIILTANHYFLDAFVGAIVVLFSMAIATHLQAIQDFARQQSDQAVRRFRRKYSERGLDHSGDTSD